VSLTGIIATSPLVKQTVPAPKLLRWLGGKASTFAPHTLMAADVDPKELSHDPEVGVAYMKDPLVKHAGSLRHLSTMLTNGELLVDQHYKNWPKDLPVYLTHGTEDKVTSHVAVQAFHDKIVATNKEIKMFQGGLHELHNEPDGVKEELLADIVTFIEARLSTTPQKDTLTEGERSKM